MEEIATLREGQARLARDVHDVVGHSLTVILAQAESAQFLDGADSEALQATMANIAKSARSSLQEVRAVLASPDGNLELRTDLDTLIDATRASGNDIAVADTGVLRPLPPELATVAFRVLQEMLTNAIKHGRRDEAITVLRDWGDELQLTVTNHVDDRTDAPAASSGNGIDGMRRRLESVGGSLDVRGASESREIFTASATMPVRAGQALRTVGV
jgi:signal transduction histidine kinase